MSEIYEKTCFHWERVCQFLFRILNKSCPIYPHLIFLQAAASVDPPPAKTAFPAVLNPAAPIDCSRATRLPVPTPPPPAAAAVDISQEATVPATMPADEKPAAAMARGAPTTVAT